MYFRNALEALGHTPLVELPEIVKNKKVHILAKLEGQNLGGSASAKDRVAKYMIEVAVKNGQLNKDMTIIEATSGNTGIALAWLGKKMGYNVTIVMPENMSVERQLLIKTFGAELILTKAQGGVLGSMNLVKEMVAKIINILWQTSLPILPIRWLIMKRRALKYWKIYHIKM
jgi:cysteine synthase